MFLTLPRYLGYLSILRLNLDGWIKIKQLGMISLPGGNLGSYVCTIREDNCG